MKSIDSPLRVTVLRAPATPGRAIVVAAVPLALALFSNRITRADDGPPQPPPSGRFGGATYGGNAAAGADPAAELARCFAQSVKDKINEGYFVRNDGFIKSILNIPNGTINPFANKQGGRCGEFGGWGMEWIKPCVAGLPGAVIDDIVVEEKSTVRNNSDNPHYQWYDSLNPDKLLWSANHRATRVILPDGRRFVVDYWDGVSTGTGRLVPESEWAAKWLKLVGDDLFGPQDSIVMRGQEEMTLKNLINKAHGDEEKAFEVFRRAGARDKYDTHPETWINSWKREPW